ncbi:hypothetical protein HanXRQr2_Chr05g0210131 [Helianthus annuus]|uniref:Uncharacterized protein n=1 Tax=Helianthus annuus TaxID=4232 RepID=A0A9K3NMR5_HELAN|nr:hypothetical protein HanXRQr2_Chr05g0210131 [Helianthus annuus]
MTVKSQSRSLCQNQNLSQKLRVKQKNRENWLMIENSCYQNLIWMMDCLKLLIL